MPPKKSKKEKKEKKEETDTEASEDGLGSDIEIDNMEDVDIDGGVAVEDVPIDGGDDDMEMDDPDDNIERIPPHEQFTRPTDKTRENYLTDMKKIFRMAKGKDRPIKVYTSSLGRIPYNLTDPKVFRKFRILAEKVRGNSKYAEKTFRVYQVMDSLR